MELEFHTSWRCPTPRFAWRVDSRRSLAVAGAATEDRAILGGARLGVEAAVHANDDDSSRMRRQRSHEKLCRFRGFSSRLLRRPNTAPAGPASPCGHRMAATETSQPRRSRLAGEQTEASWRSRRRQAAEA